MNPLRTAIRMTLFAAGLMLVCGLGGCRKSTTVTAPDGSQFKVSKKGDQLDMTIQGAKGEKIRISGGEAGVEMPKDFPSDVPIYPGANVTMAMDFGKAKNVILSCPDDRAKVAAFFKEKMKENGWSSEATMDTPQGAMMHGKKGDRSLSVFVSSADKGTTANVTVSQDK